MMKRNNARRALCILVSVILVLSSLLSLASCRPSYTGSVLGKESVRYKLLEYDLPEFNGELFGAIEICFTDYYYKDLENFETLAEKTYSAYNEFCRDMVNAESIDEVTLALIDCYIYAVGDRYASYRTAEESDEHITDMSGSFVGIGVSVISNSLESTIEVISTEVDSPAALAGIMQGDFIVAVDGVRIAEVGTSEAVNRIRGEIGTTVSVTVDRDGTEITFNIVRREITETSVFYKMLEGTKIAYIEITGFKANTANQFVTAINSAEADGAESIIFDLRNNPGGYVAAAENMLSYLVPDGTPILSFSSLREPLYAKSGTSTEPTDHALTVPSVVLCNENSASAAEIFISVMRDYDDMGLLDATVAGQVTYKKGVMQSTIDFTDKSTLTLTTALYYPPSGQNFHEVGITPDIFIENDEEFIEKALEIAAELIKEAGKPSPNNSDI